MYCIYKPTDETSYLAHPYLCAWFRFCHDTCLLSRTRTCHCFPTIFVGIVIMDCAVCGADASGLYYDARLQTCFACRVFFRRTAIKSNLPLCINLNQNCAINIENRTACKYCRYQKCIDIGM